MKSQKTKSVKIKKSKTKKPQTFIDTARTTRVAKNTILSVIILAMLAVLVYTIFSIIATPEYLVKKQINSIVADYYENYFYENNILLPNNLKLEDVKTSENAKNNLSEILNSYLETGFSRITLKQVLLSNDRERYASAGALAEYCDLDKTIVRIFPLEPYTIKDYRVDYNYSCNF